MMVKQLSILIPMYNEKNVAVQTAKETDKYFSEIFPRDQYEIVFCNDGSTDGCGELLEELSLPNVKVVGYQSNRGKGAAIRYGIALCEGKYIVCTDCDLAYGCDSVKAMYDKLVETDSDLVIGSRNITKDGYDGYTFLRKLMSKAYIKIISLLSGFSYTDSQCGIKAYKTDSAREIFSKCTVDGFAYDLEVLILADKLGMKVTENAVKILNHTQSSSKVKPLSDSFKMISDVLRIKKAHKNVTPIKK